jgi:hypothetical protein
MEPHAPCRMSHNRRETTDLCQPFHPGISHDVWPLIFGYLPDSEDQTVRNLTMTCSSFRYIAQPLLFRNVTVRPFRTFVKFDHSKVQMALQPTEVEWHLSRLQFLTSPRIAPAVRRVQAIPTETWQRDFPVRTPGEVDTILSALLSALPAFPNLREVVFNHLDFSSAHIELLSRVQRFRTLMIVGCTAPSFIPSHHLLAVDFLRVTPSVDTGGISHLWMGAIKLEIVSTLYFSTSEHTHTFLTAARARCMQALRSLDINITYSSTPHILSVLSALPRLEVLNMTTFFRGENPTSDGQDLDFATGKITLPSLHHYNGPLNILLHLHLPSLSFLNIAGISETIPAEPDALIRLLPYIQEMLPSAKDLGFVVLFLTESMSKMLLTFLPPDSQVECLRYFICNPRPTAVFEIPDTDSLEVFIFTSMSRM